MAVYEFRLEEKRGGEFRRGRVAAPSRDAGEHIVERRELQKVIYQLDPSELEQIERKLQSGEPPTPRERAQLLVHRQEKPYKLKSLEKS